REKRWPEGLRGDLPAGRRPPEEENRRRQRPAEKGGDRREGARQDEELSHCPLHSNEPDGERAKRHPERDQRSLGAENEPERERREGRGEDARERDRRGGGGPATCPQGGARRGAGAAT